MFKKSNTNLGFSGFFLYNNLQAKHRYLRVSQIMTHIINIIKKEQNIQTMMSLEIAELTGKQHFHVMEAIRKMEPAWKKVCKSNFRFTSRTIVQPNGGTREVPCYSLTKTEQGFL